MLTHMMTEFTPLMQLQSEMNRLFENFFEDSPALRSYAAGYPSVNLWEDGPNAYLEAELPGLNLEDLELLVTGNELTINGERKHIEEPSATYHRHERGTGRFSRTVTLPWEVDADKVEAKLADGILIMTLPKSESCKPKKVKLLST